jgi:hypothetical protein
MKKIQLESMVGPGIRVGQGSAGDTFDRNCNDKKKSPLEGRSGAACSKWREQQAPVPWGQKEFALWRNKK